MASRSKALSLYRGLVRAGKGYPDYNVRDFIVRRTREDFRNNKALTGAAAEAALADGQSQLSVVLRQSTIAGFYKAEPSVMEALESQSAKAKGRSLAAAAGQTSLGSSGAVVDDV